MRITEYLKALTGSGLLAARLTAAIIFVVSVWAQPLQARTTAPADTSAVEWIEVYFNMPADTSWSRDGIAVNHSWDLISTLTDLIDKANYSVDLAIYDFQNHRVGEALVRASERGVRVRVISDITNRDRNPRFTEPLWEMLRQAGITTMDDSGTVYWPDGRVDQNRLPGSGSFMHHKFAVIDAISSDPEDRALQHQPHVCG
jgi:phosphatidylserine/phosphatidylglycerophosphate/cardiolipin synthase-like enzyme